MSERKRWDHRQKTKENILSKKRKNRMKNWGIINYGNEK